MTYGVVVRGPENVVPPAIRGVIRNPAIELVGVIAHSGPLTMQDTGEKGGTGDLDSRPGSVGG